MLLNNHIRSLTTALTGLMLLVSLTVILLLTSAFLYSQETASPKAGLGSDGRPAPIAAAMTAPLTAGQQHGKELFVNNCAQCHALTADVLVGPGLLGVTARTPGEAWLINWIRNSQAVVATGDPYAVQLYAKFNRVAMSSFPNLTGADIRAILSYVDAPKPSTPSGR